MYPLLLELSKDEKLISSQQKKYSCVEIYGSGLHIPAF